MSIIQARERRVCRSSLTRFDPVWSFEVAEIIEITGPPEDFLIRRLKVRILHGPPAKSRGYGAIPYPLLFFPFSNHHSNHILGDPSTGGAIPKADRDARGGSGRRTAAIESRPADGRVWGMIPSG